MPSGPFSLNIDCNCCTPPGCPCTPCSIPQHDLTLTVTADPSCALICDCASTTLTLAYGGSCTTDWTATLVCGSSTVYFLFGCLSGVVTLQWGFDADHTNPVCILLPTDSDCTYTCSPFSIAWTAPHNASDGFPSTYVCGCCFTKLTVTG